MQPKIKEWPFNRDAYVRNPKMWIQHYMELCNQETADRKNNPIYRAKLALYKLKKKMKKWIS
jgi:hypothetical protein